MITGAFKDVTMVMIFIFIITYYVYLAYTMINYVDEVNNVAHCKTILETDGNIIQMYGGVQFAPMTLIALMILYIFLMSLFIFATSSLKLSLSPATPSIFSFAPLREKIPTRVR